MTVTIREAARDDADLATIVAIVNAVTPGDPTSIDEIHWADATYPGTVRLLAEIEGLAARYAASLNPKRRAELGTELRQPNEDLRRAAQARRPDVNQVFELDQMLHRRLVESAAGSRLLSLHEAIKPQAERYGRVYAAALTDEILNSVEEHAQLIQAVEAGDPDGAQRAVLTNWRTAAARLSHVIDTMGERGSW